MSRQYKASEGLAHSLDLLQDTYNYNHWIYSLIRPYIGDKVLEIGSGCGNISRFLLDRKTLTCVEPVAAHVVELKQLADIHHNVEVVNAIVEDLPNQNVMQLSYDSVVCINVLEHVADDSQALINLFETLRPGGALLLYVPAFSWAYGELDRELHHYRRYGRRGLRRKLETAGFTIAHCRYVNFLGAFGWWWSARILKERMIDPRKARLVDRIAPHLMAWEDLVHPMIGQSLFFVAKRPFKDPCGSGEDCCVDIGVTKGG